MPHENNNFIQQPKFAQIYIFDSENELQYRIQLLPEIQTLYRGH